MFDPDDPDCPPMPPDDPVSHQLMKCVDCKPGAPCWRHAPHTPYADNPNWEEYLPPDEGEVVLDMQGAVQMAPLQSTDYQEQLETLYLSSLDVTFERFRFDTQYFGGSSIFFTRRRAEAVTGPASGRASWKCNPSRLGSPHAVAETHDDRRRTGRRPRQLAGLAVRRSGRLHQQRRCWTSAWCSRCCGAAVGRGCWSGSRFLSGRCWRTCGRWNVSRRLLFERRHGPRFGTTARRAAAVSSAAAVWKGSRASAAAASARVGGFGGFGNQDGGFGFTGGAGASRPAATWASCRLPQIIRNQYSNVAARRQLRAAASLRYDAGRIDRFQVDLARQALYNAQSQLLNAEADTRRRSTISRCSLACRRNSTCGLRIRCSTFQPARSELGVCR